MLVDRVVNGSLILQVFGDRHWSHAFLNDLLMFEQIARNDYFVTNKKFN